MTPTSSLSPTELSVSYLLRHNFNVTAFRTPSSRFSALPHLLPWDCLVLQNVMLYLVITLAKHETGKSKV